LIMTTLRLSRRRWAEHFGQSTPFQESSDRLESKEMRADLQYGQRKLTCSWRSLRRSREILSTIGCTLSPPGDGCLVTPRGI
jgi:hypothetical protein